MINPYAFVSFLSSWVLLALGVFVFAQEERERVNTVFLLLCVSETLRTFGEHAVLGAESPASAAAWKKFGTVWPFAFAICLSGYTDDTVVRNGVLEGSAHFLQKPFSPKALATKVREVLEAEAG